MKTLKSTTSLYFLAVVLSAAVLNPNPKSFVLPAQEIVSSIIDKHLGNVTTDVIGGDYSVGYLFSPETEGKITKLKVKLPQNGHYKVSIWDIESQTVITQTTVSQNPGQEAAVKEIPDLHLKANATYAVCILLPVGTKYYHAANLNLPISSNKIRIMNSVAAFGDTYPVDLTMSDALFGLVDFAFVAHP